MNIEKNKMIKAFLVLFMGLFLAFLVAGCGGQKTAEKPAEQAKPAAPQQEKIVVKLNGTLPVGHYLTKAIEKYKEIVESKAGDRVEIQLYPAQQLYSDKDIVQVLPRGGVEMGLIQLDMWTGLIPSGSILFMPTLYEDENHYHAIRSGLCGQTIAKDFEEKAKCKLLAWADYCSIEILSKKPIKKMEDFKGQRLRSYGETASYFLQAVGAAPVTMSSGETYQALQRGTLDGAASGAPTFVSRKWYEVAKNVTAANLQPFTTFALVANLDFWNKLPADLQKVFQDAAKEMEKWAEQANAEEDGKAKETLKSKGVTVNVIPKEEVARWRAKALPVIEAKFKENVGAEKAKKMLDEVEALRKK